MWGLKTGVPRQVGSHRAVLYIEPHGLVDLEGLITGEQGHRPHSRIAQQDVAEVWERGMGSSVTKVYRWGS